MHQFVAILVIEIHKYQVHIIAIDLRSTLKYCEYYGVKRTLEVLYTRYTFINHDIYYQKRLIHTNMIKRKFLN